jgi:hypothetical protein
LDLEDLFEDVFDFGFMFHTFALDKIHRLAVPRVYNPKDHYLSCKASILGFFMGS